MREEIAQVDAIEGEIITTSDASTEETKNFRTLSESEISELREQIQVVSKNFDERKYIVSTERSFVTKCLNFIENDVKYDGKDALGVIRLHNALKEAKEESATLQSDEYNFGMTNIHLEALYYYLQKATGTGYNSALKLAAIVEPVLICLNEAMVRKSKVQSYLDKLNAKIMGLLDPDELIEFDEEN
jgi:hypothetical protein